MSLICVASGPALARSEATGIVLIPFRSAPPGTEGVVSSAPDPVITFFEKAMETGAADAVAAKVVNTSLSIVDSDEASVRLARMAYDPDAVERRKRVRKLLDDAYDEYFALDLPAARRNLGEAAGAMGRSLQTSEDLLILSDINLLEGIIALGSNAASADENFDLVLRLTPGRTIDSKRFPPYAVQALRRAKERFDLLPTTQVNVESDPPDALISIDGAERGRTPRTIDRIPSGKHFYRLEKAGMRPLLGPIVFEADKVTPLSLHLEPARFLDLQAQLLTTLHESGGSPASALSRLFSASRVVLATIAPDGPRHYTVAMWWADEQGKCSWPLRRTLDGDPVLLAPEVAAMTRDVLASPPGESREPSIDMNSLARDVALLAAGSINGALKAPPKVWYRRKTTWMYGGIGAGVLLLGIAAYSGTQPGHVDYNVTLKPDQ